jgi:outer membrane receptor for ferric coprogen and ferric-rhodotorulic acid
LSAIGILIHPMTPDTLRHSSTHGLCVLLGLIATASLSAQVQTQPASASSSSTAAAKPAADEIVQLSAFEVEDARDYGYRATNSSSATGSGTAVRDTPMSIAIITEDYIRDKNFNDLQDVIRNISSITAEGKEENVVTSRGFTAVKKQDGDETEGLYGTYNVGRVEVIKGAVSVLQGRASAGGVVNVISRRPKGPFSPKKRSLFASFSRVSACCFRRGTFCGLKYCKDLGSLASIL